MQNQARPNQKILWFAIYTAACAAYSWTPLRGLFQLSLSSDTNSYILLIPFVSLTLLFLKRERLLSSAGQSLGAAAGLFLSGLLLREAVRRFGFSLSQNDSLGLAVLAFVLLIWAGFLFLFGSGAFKMARFPLLFLLLMIPLPEFLMDRFIAWLQAGSADVTYWLFSATGTPVLRQGLIFTVPGATIEIAKECSGIRSTLALLIICLLVGYRLLRTSWARAVLLLSAIPVLVIKNGIRIVTLTLLAIRVDPSFLTGNLHHDGGFVFFGIGLLILLPVLLWLQKTELRLVRRTEVVETGPGSESSHPSQLSQT